MDDVVILLDRGQVFFVGPVPGEHLQHQDAEREHVTGRSDFSILRLLRAHIAQGADQGSIVGDEGGRRIHLGDGVAAVEQGERVDQGGIEF